VWQAGSLALEARVLSSSRLGLSFEGSQKMALPEYERIAQSALKPASPAPANISAVEENAASGEVAALYDHFRTHFGRPDVPGILRCFATHPPLLRHMMELSESLIFADGYLARKHKEMIGTLVSSQNACPYCTDSHGYFLRVHGGSANALGAIRAGDLGSSSLTAGEQALLRFARKVNLNSQDISRRDVELLIQTGWSESQIAEAVHVAALFSTFNRVANAFGLVSQGLLSLYDAHAEEEQSSNSALERTSQ
jgi:uncharacterized peroxidase-related enzyme